MHKILITFFVCCMALVCHAQYQKVTTFSKKDGLPSNNIYKCIEDNKGFLWIGTDAEIARFDGRHFQVFTRKQGVPDVDIRNLVVDKGGLLWIEGYTETLAYFDTLRNRFVNAGENKNITVAIDTAYRYQPLFALPEGGVEFTNLNRSYIIRNKRATEYPNTLKAFKNLLIKVLKDSSQIRLIMESERNPSWVLCHVKNGIIIEKAIIEKNGASKMTRVNDSSLFLFDQTSSRVMRITNFKTSPLRFITDSFISSGPHYDHNFTDHYLTNLNEQGDIHVYNKKTLRHKFLLKFGEYITNLYDDKKGNLWLSSCLGKGLNLYIPQIIRNYNVNDSIKNNSCMSIAKKTDGTILTGNNQGEIDEYGTILRRHTLPNAKSTDVQNNIIFSQHKVFSFGENGICVNYTKRLNRQNNQCKIAYALNDSIILCGFSDNDAELCKLNTITEKLTTLCKVNMPITSLANINQHGIYIGSTDGLRYYSFHGDTCTSLQNRNILFKERIVSMCTTSDSLLWIATATNGIIIVKNNQVVFHLTDSTGLRSENSESIISGKGKQVWLGTNSGLSVINYSYGKCNIQNISSIDGLNSNSINQLVYQHDTVFAATENGVSAIPVNISMPRYDIPIELTGVKIDNIDTTLSHYYHLKPNQYYITIQFSCIELTGHFRNAQYSSDRGISWIDIEGVSLSQQLSSGNHSIWIRAFDVNGHTTNRILKLAIDIDFPFYKLWWFWLPVILFFLLISIYINTILTKRKQQRRIDELMNQQALDELEIQALKAQINPHFVFNCLNSIKGFIYDEDFEMADLYLDKFAQLLRSTLNYSSQPSICLQQELEYIDTYLVLEQLRFGNKFKYSIECTPDINQQEVYIPAMILQPYVENAIKHGVCNLDDGLGKIRINVYLVANAIHVEIDDNGVGREKATELKQNRRVTHESKGTQLTERRIELYRIDLSITDKQDEKGQAIGTNIHLTIPIPLTINSQV